MRVGAILLSIGAVVAVGGPARANETDPWYAWTQPPRDGTSAINRVINERLERGLDYTSPAMECSVAARRMTTSMRKSALFFFLGDLPSWGADYTPRTSSEYFEQMSPRGAYRHVYGLMPLDPAMRSGDILFGTDKFGHFFSNGLRQYDHYREARARGVSDLQAIREAIGLGIQEEKTWLGLYPAGIFSYADLEANFQGLMFYRSLCEGGELQRVEGAWVLTEPFDIARWVGPCWDEAWRPSYFGRTANAFKQGLSEMCSELELHTERMQRYSAQGCPSEAIRIVDELIASGELPDPSPWSWQEVCAKQRNKMD